MIPLNRKTLAALLDFQKKEKREREREERKKKEEREREKEKKKKVVTQRRQSEREREREERARERRRREKKKREEEGKMTDALKKPTSLSIGTKKDKDVTLDLTKKHPLEHSWTFWFDNPNGKQKQTTWGQTLRSVYTFKTIEDFWCLYNNVVPPSRLVTGADLHVFKEGIEPKWEDPMCANGGKWTVTFLRQSSKGTTDASWLNLLLAMIGEQFAESDEICGAVVSVRNRGDRLALWTKTASNEAGQISIGKALKQFVDLPETTSIGYLTHADAKRLDKKAKDRYVL